MKQVSYLLAWLGLIGCILMCWNCGTKNYAASPSHEISFTQPFNLSQELLSAIKEQPKNEIHFQVLDKAGAPIPYALLRMEWTENGGRMSFQTDEHGTLHMHFEEDILAFEVMVFADVKPIGQDLLKTEDYETSSTPLEEGHILVRW